MRFSWQRWSFRWEPDKGPGTFKRGNQLLSYPWLHACSLGTDLNIHQSPLSELTHEPEPTENSPTEEGEEESKKNCFPIILLSASPHSEQGTGDLVGR